MRVCRRERALQTLHPFHRCDHFIRQELIHAAHRASLEARGQVVVKVRPPNAALPASLPHRLRYAHLRLPARVAFRQLDDRQTRCLFLCVVIVRGPLEHKWVEGYDLTQDGVVNRVQACEHLLSLARGGAAVPSILCSHYCAGSGRFTASTCRQHAASCPPAVARARAPRLQLEGAVLL